MDNLTNHSTPSSFNSYQSSRCIRNRIPSRGNRSSSAGSCTSSLLFDSDDEPILQSRKLAGDISNKGMPWISTLSSRDERRQHHDEIPPANKEIIVKNAVSNKRTEEPGNVRATKTSADNDGRRMIGDSARKVHIVTCKPNHYGHLLSEQRVMPKGEVGRPIVYKRQGDENGRKEVAPLWFHPLG